MTRGTRLIAVLSALVGLAVAIVPPIVNYRSCQADQRAYTEDQQDWAAVLQRSKTLQQVSERALIRAHDDEDFRQGRWHVPTCHVRDDSIIFGLIGLASLVAIFIGAHLAWLAVRAFNKLMDKLK
ncbi:hypothetical protein R70199_08105 [Paraburkholderia domus]|nr:hypothetical protein R70199_08105 [Paraburkholderia domus]